MIELEMEKERVERLHLQKLGEDWIRAIMEGALDQLEQLCHANLMSRLLLPAGLVTLHNAADLIAEYRAWFGGCTNFQLEASRVAKVGERLGIFYRFHLQDQGDWYNIEQQVYCTLKDGQVERLHLLCSGFQLVGVDNQTKSV